MAIVSRYEIHRGRQDELEKTGPGTAVITMIDLNGTLDPSSGSADYHPMRPVSISLTNPINDTSHPIFTGHVARWSYDLYPTERYGVATIECVDGMDILARMEMYAGVGHILEWGDLAFASTAQDGDVWFDYDAQVELRIGRILTQAQWPLGNRDLLSGNVSLKPTTYAYRTSVLTAIQDAADAEFPTVANFYIQKDGRATFHGRFARFRPDVADYHITTWECGDLAAWEADNDVAAIFDLDYDIDKDRIINSAIATPEGILDADIEGQRVENEASIDEYGSAAWSAENLLTAGDYLGAADANAATKKFATYHVQNYKDPRVRVKRITLKTVPMGSGMAAPLWQLMCNVDISDRIHLQTTHFTGAAGFDENYFVEGLTYTVEPLNDQYLNVTLDLDLSPEAYWTTEPA